MGFKKTSESIAISFGIDEAVANTFIEQEVALQLDVLNNEIFVVLAADINLSAPEAVPGLNTSVAGSITSTTQTAIATLANTNCIATAREQIRAFAASGVGFSRGAMESYTGDLPYIALIATNNFFVSVVGANNVGVAGTTGRIWGYRAKADSATYAALVQSEVLSA